MGVGVGIGVGTGAGGVGTGAGSGWYCTFVSTWLTGIAATQHVGTNILNPMP